MIVHRSTKSCRRRSSAPIALGSTATQGMRDLFWFQGLLGGAKAQYETTYSWELDYTKDIAKCDVPLLVIHCEDDQIVPIEPTGRRVLICRSSRGTESLPRWCSRYRDCRS